MFNNLYFHIAVYQTNLKCLLNFQLGEICLYLNIVTKSIAIGHKVTFSVNTNEQVVISPSDGDTGIRYLCPIARVLGFEIQIQFLTLVIY